MKRSGLLIIVVITLAACASSASPVSTPFASPVNAPLATVPATAVTSPLASPKPSAVTPTATDERAAVFPNTIIVYQREGGLVGVSKKWTFYRTGRILTGDGTEWQVSADQIKPLFDLVEAPDYRNLSDSYPAAACADCYTHTLTVFQKGETKQVTFVEGNGLPANLRQMLDVINQLIAR